VPFHDRSLCVRPATNKATLKMPKITVLVR
jgi:hypothetical protein